MLETALADLTAPTMVAVALAVFCASVLQSALGIGFGVIAGPVLMLASPEAVPGVVLLLGGSTAFLSAVRGRRDIRPGELGIAMVGRLAGTLAAAGVLWAIPSREVFAVVFSMALLVVVGLSATRPPIPLTRRTLAVAGGFSGLLGTLVAVGALPMGLVYQGQAAASARATLNTFFAIGVIPSIAALAATGYLGATQVLQAVLLIPFVLLGHRAARDLLPFVDERYRPVVLGFCAVAALVVAVRAIADIV